MAAASIGKPGTEHGPCVEPCGHRGCRRSRGEAATECAICHEPIGYDRSFYRDQFPAGIFVYTHAVCIEDREAKRSKLKEEAS